MYANQVGAADSCCQSAGRSYFVTDTEGERGVGAGLPDFSPESCRRRGIGNGRPISPSATPVGNARGLASIRDTLQTKNVLATFYPIGSWTRTFPADANQLVTFGFQVGNNSDTHPHFPALTDAQVRTKVLNAQ